MDVFPELFAEETAVIQQTALVQEEAATKIQAAFRGMQVREQVKTMKTEAQVKPQSGSPHDDLEFDDLDLDIFAPKSAASVDKDKVVTASDNKVDNACQFEVDPQHRNGALHEHVNNSVEESSSASGSDSSSELGDDFELIKDNWDSVVEYEDKQARGHESKHLDSSDSATSLPDILPINTTHISARNNALKEDNFPVTKGGLQKSKVGYGE